jgi:glycosyltransferase involved in cell wall biosynthesis
LKVGLRHIVADDVFVFHKGSSSFTDAAKTQKDRNDALVAERYPWYLGSVQRASTDPYSPLATAINRASLQLRSPSIAVDGHCFASSWAGTQQTTFELIKAVARNRPTQEFTVIFSEHASTELIRRVTAEPNTRAEIVPNIMEDFSFRFDVIIRPHQVNSTEELRWMKRVANRTIVAQLDFISYSNPTYFADDHTWLSQRELTKLVHSSVDGVAWISEYVRQDAIKSGVRRPTALDAVIHCGTESSERSTKNPEPVDRLNGIQSPIITLFGVGYSHKSRPFAIRVLAELARRGVDCHLVLAGQSPPFGSSMSDEEAILRDNPQLTERVTMLSALTDGQRDWLYMRSSLVLYPSVSEGFGLVPFEAARHGTATLASRMGSLDEVLPTEIPAIDNFDPRDTAKIVEQLLASPQKTASMAESIARRGADFTWDRTALSTLDLIDRVLGGPRNNIDSVWGEGPEAAAVHGADYIERIRRKNRRASLYRRVTASGLGRILIGPPGSRRRGLLKVVYRRR